MFYHKFPPCWRVHPDSGVSQRKRGSSAAQLIFKARSDKALERGLQGAARPAPAREGNGQLDALRLVLGFPLLGNAPKLPRV